LNYFQEGKILSVLNVLFRSVFIYPSTSPAAVIWVFGRFILDSFVDAVARTSLKDTMMYMFLGLVGGAALIVFMARYEIKEYIKKAKTPR
jgi:H+/Cl- antiporter ClcA